uniref:Chondromodulin n=1 Tax=Oncorhynchus mykiss TaxID=8022 RepID=A0A8K9UCI9_ONCMY
NQIKSNLFYIALRTGEKDQGVTQTVRSSAAKPPVAVGRLLRFGVETLVAGEVLMLCVSIGAFNFWKVMKFDKKSLTWVATDRPLKNSSFLSTKILDLCGDLPIFWLQPTYHKERRTRDTQRAKRQFDMKEFEAAAEEKNTKRGAVYQVHVKTLSRNINNLPITPQHHQGIFCSECRHSYIHCCQVSYRDILPCRWWVACILGVVSVVHAHFLKPNSPTVLKVMFCKQQCHLYADIYCITLYLVVNTG